MLIVTSLGCILAFVSNVLEWLTGAGITRHVPDTSLPGPTSSIATVAVCLQGAIIASYFAAASLHVVTMPRQLLLLQCKQTDMKAIDFDCMRQLYMSFYLDIRDVGFRHETPLVAS